MSLVVINPGPFATVQDEGRIGYREWGVPVGGAFDRLSAALANALLGNPAGCAVLELTLFGGIYEARAPLALALAGAPMAVSLERGGGPGRTLALPRSFEVAPGDRLIIGGTTAGARTYLAVKGGWKTPLTLGSRSREEPLRPGDVLDAEPGRTPGRRPVDFAWESPVERPLRIIDGPDRARATGFEVWASARFRVGPQSGRMGLRLEGPALTVDSPPDRLSSPVAPGALQVAGGQVLLLGVACGTMGGYPHVSHVISADLDRVGQLGPGNELRFERVTLDEARRIDRQARAERDERLRRLVALARDAFDSPSSRED